MPVIFGLNQQVPGTADVLKTLRIHYMDVMCCELEITIAKGGYKEIYHG
jgi:hypothetical protein